MQSRNRKANKIILIMVFFLLVLLILVLLLMYAIEQEGNDQNLNISTDIGISKKNEKNKLPKTIQEIIENSGSKYINEENGIYKRIYAIFVVDLFDEDGKSNENFFKNIIEDILLIYNDNFYLIDNEKNFQIYVEYDKKTGKYIMTINDIKDFYKETNGKIYEKISNTEIVKKTLPISLNVLLQTLEHQGMYYANTILASESKIEKENNYYEIVDEGIIAKLNGGKVLHIIFTKDYEDRVLDNYTVETSLETIFENYPEPAFGSVKDGFLGYRFKAYYMFFYKDEISVYPYQYEENRYFDKYLLEYQDTGDLDKLVSDFTSEWVTYFDFKYEADEKNLYLVFPTRGIEFDIKNNKSQGIKIYNNYYMSDNIKLLIKNETITLEPNKDLIYITEQKRRESID